VQLIDAPFSVVVDSPNILLIGYHLFYYKYTTLP
jgi:hypothetical protein